MQLLLPLMQLLVLLQLQRLILLLLLSYKRIESPLHRHQRSLEVRNHASLCGNSGVEFAGLGFRPSCEYLYLLRLAIDYRAEFVHRVELLAEGQC